MQPKTLIDEWYSFDAVQQQYILKDGKAKYPKLGVDPR